MMSDSSTSHKLTQYASKFAILVALTLVFFKFWAWRVTHSVSLQASLIDSLLDMVASIINFFMIRTALKPADAEHRFGHGKAEALGGIGQSVFIAASALWLLIETIQRLIDPVQIQQTILGSKVMVFAIILTSILVLFQMYVIKRTRSLAIEADCLHYKSDIILNLGVLISLNLSSILDWERLDPFVGASLSIYILYSSWQIAKKSLNVLMDHELPEEVRHKILNLILNHKDVLGVHELRTRSSGQKEFIQMHLDLDGHQSLQSAHEIGDAICKTIMEHFPNAEVIIHQDPIILPSSPSNK